MVGVLAVKGLFQLAKGRGDNARQCLISMGIRQGLVVGRDDELV